MEQNQICNVIFLMSQYHNHLDHDRNISSLYLSFVSRLSGSLKESKYFLDVFMQKSLFI